MFRIQFVQGYLSHVWSAWSRVSREIFAMIKDQEQDSLEWPRRVSLNHIESDSNLIVPQGSQATVTDAGRHVPTTQYPPQSLMTTNLAQRNVVRSRLTTPPGMIETYP